MLNLIKKLFLKLFKKQKCFYINGPETLPPPLSKEEEQKIMDELQNGIEDNRELLIIHNLRLVVYIAKKFDNTGVSVEDLISIGTIGLIKAINTFNPVKNIKLAEDANDKDMIAQTIADTLHMCKVAMVLLHPVVPANIEKLAKDLGVSDNIFSWDGIEQPIYNFFENKEHHKPMFLEAKQDFFKKHPSQLVFDEE